MAILDNYTGPASLKKMSHKTLRDLAAELRELIIKTTAANGGHIGPSLGAVELSIALHAALDTPEDKIVWDVGHQAYAHKILTGRKDQISTIRQYKGLSGFTKRGESPYDIFGAGHASTSVSAAVGLALARDLAGEDYGVFAVVGDGSFSGGMVFEALNNCEKLCNFAVILNDNCMSISHPVGVISRIITRLRVSNFYTGLKNAADKILKNIPMLGRPLHRTIELLIKRTGGLLLEEISSKEPVGFFQDMGFTYLGPLDGHNITLLMAALRYARTTSKPLLIHLLTTKGKGFKPAELDPVRFHGTGKFNIENGELIGSAAVRSYTKVFGEELLLHGRENPKLTVLSAAMPTGTGTEQFGQEFPSRFFDVGIAEEHAVTSAGGMACAGAKPVVAIYSTFLQRAYDQIVHDIALQKLPVLFALDRGGLVGDDGPTHHGVFDLSYLRHIPNMVVSAPADGNDLKDLLLTGLAHNGPFALRYPRGEAYFRQAERLGGELPIGKAEIIYGTERSSIVVWAIGSMVQVALEAAQQSEADVAVVNARFVKPLDRELLAKTVANAQKIITIEENVLAGGFGSAVLEALQELKLSVPVERLGIKDGFVEHGPVAQLRQDCGLTTEALELLFKQ